MEQVAFALAAKLPGYKLHSSIEYYIEIFFDAAQDRKASFHNEEEPMRLSLPRTNPVARPATEVQAMPPGRRVPVVAVITLSASALAAIGAGVLGAQTKSAADALASATNGADYAGRHDHAQRLATTTNAVWIGAAQLGAASAALFIVRS